MRRVGMLALLCGTFLIAAGAHAQTPAQAPAQAPAKAPAKEPSAKSGLGLSDTSAKPWTGDLDGMIKRRMIRVLVPYSKTYYFVDRAVQRRETVTYVSNIYKYYLAYQMIEEERAEREKVKGAVKQDAGK